MDWTPWQVHSEEFFMKLQHEIIWRRIDKKSMNKNEFGSHVCFDLSLPVPQRGATAGELLHDGGKVNFEEVDFRFPQNVLMFVSVWLMCCVFLSAIVSVSCFLMLEYSLRTCCSFEPSNSPSCICHDGGSRRAIVVWCRVFILDWKNCQWIGGTKNGNIPKYKKSLQIVKSTVEIEAWCHTFWPLMCGFT